MCCPLNRLNERRLSAAFWAQPHLKAGDIQRLCRRLICAVPETGQRLGSSVPRPRAPKKESPEAWPAQRQVAVRGRTHAAPRGVIGKKSLLVPGWGCDLCPEQNGHGHLRGQA